MNQYSKEVSRCEFLIEETRKELEKSEKEMERIMFREGIDIILSALAEIVLIVVIFYLVKNYSDSLLIVLISVFLAVRVIMVGIPFVKRMINPMKRLHNDVIFCQLESSIQQKKEYIAELKKTLDENKQLDLEFRALNEVNGENVADSSN